MQLIDHAATSVPLDDADIDEKDDDMIDAFMESGCTVLSIQEKELEGSVSIVLSKRRKAVNVTAGFMIDCGSTYSHDVMDLTPERLGHIFMRFIGHDFDVFRRNVIDGIITISELGCLTVILRRLGKELQLQLYSSVMMEKVSHTIFLT